MNYDVVTQMSHSIHNSCIPKMVVYLKMPNTKFLVSLFKVHIHSCPLHEDKGKEGGVTPLILKLSTGCGVVITFTTCQLQLQKEGPNSY